jgi:hypothetical protein
LTELVLRYLKAILILGLSLGVEGLFSYYFPGNTLARQPFPFGAFADNYDPPASPFALSAITPKYAPSNAKVWSCVATQQCFDLVMALSGSVR